jgi:hypothetical protein
VASVASGEEVGDEVLDFFFLKGVEKSWGHEGNFGDFAFLDFGLGDGLGFVGLGDVGGEVNFLVVASGFAAEEYCAVFESNSDGGVLFGDDEGGLKDFGE